MMRFIAGSAATVATFALAFPVVAQEANVNAPATITVANTVIRPKNKVMPLGANNFGGMGPVDVIANNYINNPYNEPMSVRHLYRVTKSFGNSAELDRGGVGKYDLYNSGYLSGAYVRVYRLVDKDGKTLPQTGKNPNDTYIDVDKAASVKLVREGRVVAEGVPGFPSGGWVNNKYANVKGFDPLRYNLKHTDFLFQKPGRTYFYAVTAIDANGNESEISNEVSATPGAENDNPPRIVVTSNGEATIRKDVKANSGFGDWGGALNLRALGGKGPMKWELLDRNNNVIPLPEGMKITTGEADASRFNLANAKLEGGLKEEPKNFFFRVRVTDAQGNSDTRDYVVNPPEDSKNAGDKDKPTPPPGVTVVANTNSATLSWQPSPSADVVGYRVYRSEAPKAKQEERVYLEGDGPALEKDDYIFFNRILTEMEPSYTHPRVGFEPGLTGFYGTTWSASNGVLQTLAPHDPALTATFKDGGKTALKLVSGEGDQSISQNVYTGANGDANKWYTQLEPGKNYRLEVWLRGENLGDGGKVTFGFNNNRPGYSELSKTFDVTKEWQKFTYDFVAPPRPDKEGIFAHQFKWKGMKAASTAARSTLWLDNARLFRYDSPEDLTKTFAPNQTVLKELLDSLPRGAKGSWRAYGPLMNEATMDTLLSYQPSSSYKIDWMTSMGSSTAMTLPMVMDVFYRTGTTPQTRVHPFLTMQVYFTEKEWQNFIEYLAAPYDPKTDTPKTKPYAYRRTQHRGGILTPWTDEFPHISIEYGNETWHNGTFAGWEGFSRSYVSWAPDEGREIGYFTRHFFQSMVDSPYWKSQKLDNKISFNLGGFYNGNVEADGRVTGYAENARKVNPLMSQIGHATYVGPKWETGDAPLKTFSDEGVLGTLLAYVADNQPLWTQQSNAMKKLTEMGMPYDLTAYEGGPSGYFLPGSGDPDAVKSTERYGKSLAMGVAALDGWLDATKLGWTYQNFLGYGQGEYWASHTTMGNGFRPSPGWLALKMRNRFGVGEMIAADVTGPTFDRKKGNKSTNLPLIGSYAFRDGNKYGVFVLSRKINGNVAGVEFGDGSTKTTLKLPFADAEKITLYKLTGDPRATNVDAENIKLQTQEIPPSALKNNALTINSASGGVAGGMPMGSIFLYVFEGAS